jgi:putative N6-adenine-specific DNA methylase
MSAPQLFNFFSPCPRGLEGILQQELEALGAQSAQAAPGGVAYSGTWELGYKANLHSRIASRVLWQLKQAPYRNEDDVYKAAYSVDWPYFFDVDQTFMVRLEAIKSPLRSLDFITLRIKDAVVDRFRAKTGQRPSIDTAQPQVRVHAFLTQDRCTLYLDLSGAPLFQRGYRVIANEAPLRENLAAGLLHLAGWTPEQPLLDPMCGSGTILMEAALMALEIAPGARRAFGFQKLKNYDVDLWQKLVTAAEMRARPAHELPLYGSDLYGDALKAARTNFEAAGLAETVHLKQANVLEISAPVPSGVLLTNPPYGVRLGDEAQLAELYPRLGDVLKQKFTGWRAYLFTADPQLPKRIRLHATRRTVIYNGAIECRLLEYVMRPGSNR